MGKASRWILLAVQFVCPLIFFTDLTRNPYVTQIVLMNIGVLIAAAALVCAQASEGEFVLPRTPLDIPWAVFLLICSLSWILAYFGHAPFFRPAMRSEGSRVMLFTLVNTAVPFYLAAFHMRDCPEDPQVPLGRWVAFVVAWGLLWTAFPQMRSLDSMVIGIWNHVWDPYGALVWILGLAFVILLARQGSAHHFWHVALSVGFLASVYGMAQYFSLEFLWPKILDPYGGRSVSTFGNPNFLSSYLVLMLPMAAVYYLQAKTRFQRAVYAVVFLAFEAGLLCSLTRSSWAGAVAALAVLALSPQLRRRAREDIEFHGLVVVAALVLVLAWPRSTVSGYGSTVLGRLREISEIFHQTSPTAYSPWYQRVLIWLSCWMMGAENPLLGKGWGHLELFYPFYQGHLLHTFDFFQTMRTHANNAHDEVMEVWAQAGILGVGALVWMWIVFFRSASIFARVGTRASRAEPGRTKATMDVSYALVRASRAEPGRAKGQEVRFAWMWGACAGVAGMLVDNLLNVSLHFAVPAFLFWWQAGAAMGFLAHEQGWIRRLRPRSGFHAATAVCLTLAACGWGSWHWVCQWNREVYYFMGFKMMRRGSAPQAIDLLSTAYRWHPREVNTNYELGNAYARADRFDKAAWAYQEALNANAGYDEIYYNLATLLGTRLGDREGALKDFLVAWAINPLSEPLYQNLSRFYFADLGRYRADCIGLLERAVHFFPENPDFLNNLGYLYSLDKDYGKAEAAYARVLELHPEAAAAEHNLRAALILSGHRPPPVLAELDDIHRLEARLRAKDYGRQTLALARKLTGQMPKLTRLRFYQGNLELQNGNPGEARTILSQVVAEEPSNITARLNLAEVYRQQGDRARFIDALRTVVALDPGNAYASSTLRALSQH